MYGRFIGRIAAGTFDCFSAEAPCVLRGTSIAVMADGFITNLADLDEEAARRNMPAASSLSGWVGLAYGWWGNELSRYVLGQYAAAIVDPSAPSVSLIQDSLGIRPLFYRSTHESFAFATRLIDLVGLERPSSLDLAYFADSLAFAGPSTERTPYPGIRRMRSGATLHWRSGHLEVAWPWSPSMVESPVQASDEEFEEELRVRLSAAVDRAVPPHGRVWCELSGGLDSTSVLAVGRGLGHLLDAFTFVSSDRDDGGDSIAAGTATATLGVPWHTLEASDTLPFSSVPDGFRAEPGSEVLEARRAAYHALLREHDVDVVLTGAGGDVTFGSPDCLPHHLADPLIPVRPLLLWRTLRTWQRDDPRQRSTMFWFSNYSVRTAVRHKRRASLDPPGPSTRLPKWLDRGFVRRHHLDSRARLPSVPRHAIPGRQALWEEAYGQAEALGAGGVISPNVEFRHPLLDRHLLEFMLAVPYEQRQRVDNDRHLQRRALRGLVPDEVLCRRTKGSGQPSMDLGLRSNAHWHRMLTDDPRIVSAGFVDRGRWLDEVRRARFGVYESLRHFVMAASIECWLRQLEQGLPEPILLESMHGGPMERGVAGA